MALSDELAYVSGTELALRIRRRELSPVEVVDAFIARIEARNPSLNAFVYRGFDDARARAESGRAGVDVRCGARARCMACRRRSRTCSTSSRAGSAPSAACAR